MRTGKRMQAVVSTGRVVQSASSVAVPEEKEGVVGGRLGPKEGPREAQMEGDPESGVG